MSFALWLGIALGSTIQASGPQLVEPTDLTRRAELVGKDVVVDDHVRYFRETRRSLGYDELHLRRAEVVFRLPRHLRFPKAPSEPNARVRGILKVEDGKYVCDVTSIELLPGDLERLDREVGQLRPDDAAGRKAWAVWAERRGKELNEPKVVARGVELEGEAFWLEASLPGADPIALVERSADRPIPDVVRKALLHRGFRALLAPLDDPKALDALADRVRAAFPLAGEPRSAANLDPTLLAAYGKDPAGAYREASDPDRAGLDRRLLADILERSFDAKASARPGDGQTLAEAAIGLIPERPQVAARLRTRGLDDAEARVATLRQSEVEALALRFKNEGQEARGRRLVETWLADRRATRLSSSDAEGRILLAASYDKLLGDRATAGDLLREALAIDPKSKSAVDALLRLGFRKGDDGWYDPTAPTARAESAEPARQDAGESLRGLTRAQVRSRMGGKPDRVVRTATQGRCLEQWFYQNGKRTQVVQFAFEPGIDEPRASAFYSEQK
jgi:hypothetical protein